MKLRPVEIYGRSEGNGEASKPEPTRNRFVAKEGELHIEVNADVSRSSGKHYTSLPDHVSAGPYLEICSLNTRWIYVVHNR